MSPGVAGVGAWPRGPPAPPPCRGGPGGVLPGPVPSGGAGGQLQPLLRLGTPPWAGGWSGSVDKLNPFCSHPPGVVPMWWRR